MSKKLLALVAGALFGLLVGATFNDVKANPSVAGQPLGAVAVTSGTEAQCTATKIKDKTFLTAAHCVSDLKDLAVATKDQRASAQYVTIGANGDWAIIHTSGDIDVPVLALGCGSPIYLGQEVVSIGYPFPMRQQFTKGYVSALGDEQREELSNNFFLVMPGAAGGSSGSAVVDRDTGLIIGILVNAVPTPRFGGLLAVGVQGLDVYGLCLR